MMKKKTKKKQTRARYVHWCAKYNKSGTIYGKPGLNIGCKDCEGKWIETP